MLKTFWGGGGSQLKESHKLEIKINKLRKLSIILESNFDLST